jgi:CheY-like chemotaxis protein
MLTNAMQALPEGDAARHEIRVVGRRMAPGSVVIEVRDSGRGIAPEHIPRLFEPFFTTKPAGAGTGLGLPICHRIVSELGGRIDVESEPGRGSVFRVILPAAPGVEAERPAAPGRAGVPRRGRILVVDDEEAICQAMQDALEDHEVVATTGAPAALARVLGGERFDVIFGDLMMPDLSGVDFHARLLERAPEQADRVVFLTGGAFTARARQHLARVPNLRLEKPIGLHELLSIVQDRLR